MPRFELHDFESAPEDSRAELEATEEKFGFIPNVIRELAGSPPALKAYLAVAEAFAETSLSPQEQQLVLLSVAVENRCEYCVAAHSGGALQAGIPEQVVEAIRRGRTVDDDRLEALRRLSQAIVSERGWVDDDTLASFLAAGFERTQILEVLTGVTQKTLSNYTNHIADTPLDDELSDLAWSGEELEPVPV